MREIHREEKGQAVREDTFMQKCSISAYFKYPKEVVPVFENILFFPQPCWQLCLKRSVF